MDIRVERRERFASTGKQSDPAGPLFMVEYLSFSRSWGIAFAGAAVALFAAWLSAEVRAPLVAYALLVPVVFVATQWQFRRQAKRYVRRTGLDSISYARFTDRGLRFGQRGMWGATYRWEATESIKLDRRVLSLQLVGVHMRIAVSDLSDGQHAELSEHIN